MIDPLEKEISGAWVLENGRIVKDETCKRVADLIANYLVFFGRDESGWSSRYRDPIDGRIWELTFPEGELQGGGPPTLRCLE